MWISLPFRLGICVRTDTPDGVEDPKTTVSWTVSSLSAKGRCQNSSRSFVGTGLLTRPGGCRHQVLPLRCPFLTVSPPRYRKGVHPLYTCQLLSDWESHHPGPSTRTLTTGVPRCRPVSLPFPGDTGSRIYCYPKTLTSTSRSSGSRERRRVARGFVPQVLEDNNGVLVAPQKVVTTEGVRFLQACRSRCQEVIQGLHPHTITVLVDLLRDAEPEGPVEDDPVSV